MTDLEKWEKFLTEMGVLFKTDIQKDYSFGMCKVEVKVIHIGVKNDYESDHKPDEYRKWFGTHYGPSLDIVFGMNGKFKYFEPYGE